MYPQNSKPFIPSLSHLHDAFFETDDDGEGNLIQDLIKEFQANSSWPRNFYKSGDAAEYLGPYALKALGKCVEHYDDEMESRELQAEYNRRYPVLEIMKFLPSAPPKQPNKLVEEAVEIEVEEVSSGLTGKKGLLGKRTGEELDPQQHLCRLMKKGRSS